MKCGNKNFWALPAKPILLLIFLSLCTCCGFSRFNNAVISCSEPSNITVLAKDSSSVSYGWGAGKEVHSFKVWFFRAEDAYTSPEVIVIDPTISFANLPPGTYTFYFTSICDGGTTSAIIADDLIMG